MGVLLVSSLTRLIFADLLYTVSSILQVILVMHVYTLRQMLTKIPEGKRERHVVVDVFLLLSVEWRGWTFDIMTLLQMDM